MDDTVDAVVGNLTKLGLSRSEGVTGVALGLDVLPVSASAITSHLAPPQLGQSDQS